MSARTLLRRFRRGTAAVEADLRLEDERMQGCLTHDDGREETVDARVRSMGGGRFLLTVGDRLVRATVLRRGSTTWVSIDGHAVVLEAESPGARLAAPGSDEPFATSPMTGLVAKVSVAVGDRVPHGDELFVVEAMKMEYVVRAARDVVIEAIEAPVGARVAVGDVVVRFGAAS